MVSNKLKFGVMCNNTHVAKWQLETINLLIQSNLCECVLIINNAEKTINKQGLFKKLFTKDFLYKYLFNRFFTVTADKKISITDIGTVISVNTVKKGKYSEYFSIEDVQNIKSYQLDFILRFGFGIIRGDILNAAKFGIWSYHHGDEQKYRGGPFGLWEIYNNERTTSVVLQQLTEILDSGYILLKREYKTIFHSWKESRQKLLQNNTDMPLQLISILQANPNYINELKQAQSSAKIHRFPENHKMLFFLFKLFYNRLKLRFNNYFILEKWVLVLLNRKQDIINDVKNIQNLDNIIQFKNNSCFYADGFLIDDETIIFENYSYKKGKGHISIVKNKSNHATLIEKQNHLAYPYVFKHEKNIYLLPEESQSGKLELYEFIQDEPYLFSRGTILDEPAVDASMYYDGKLFWLFCGLKSNCPNEKLFLFYSDSLLGKYIPHRLNPIKVTPNGARCAGNIFKYKDKVIRPSQSCIPHYGSKIIFNEITMLNTGTFVEKPIEELNPDIFGKKYTGTHTISLSDNKILLDAKKHVFNLLLLNKKKV